MFNTRNDAYDEATQEILNHIKGVISGIELYATEEGLLTDDSSLVILTANLDHETGFVFITGIFEPAIGVTVQSTSGEQFLIETEKDQQAFSKMIKINIAREVVEKNDPEETLSYIRESNEKLQALMNALQKGEDSGYSKDNVLKSLSKEKSTDELGKNNKIPTTLTDEQRQDEEFLKKMLEGATKPSGFFN